MGLLANKWAEIQNLHLQPLGEKNSGKIWISLLIRKLWDVSWDFWNFRNHALHATDGPRKLNITELINNRVTCNLKKGSIGLPTRCHLLFHTSIQTLLTRPIRQHLSWIAATTITRLWLQHHAPMRRIPDIDEPLLGRITMGRLIPTLLQIAKDPQIRTTIGPPPSRSLHIER